MQPRVSGPALRQGFIGSRGVIEVRAPDPHRLSASPDAGERLARHKPLRLSASITASCSQPLQHLSRTLPLRVRRCEARGHGRRARGSGIASRARCGGHPSAPRSPRQCVALWPRQHYFVALSTISSLLGKSGMRASSPRVGPVALEGSQPFPKAEIARACRARETPCSPTRSPSERNYVADIVGAIRRFGDRRRLVARRLLICPAAAGDDDRLRPGRLNARRPAQVRAEPRSPAAPAAPTAPAARSRPS